MARTKKFFAGIALALVVFFSGIISIGPFSQNKASALSPDYHGETQTIYYFSDSYPILNENYMTIYFGSYYLVYDIHYGADSLKLANMYANNYFDGFESGCVVIFEIKIYQPDPSVLEDIFAALKEQECIVVFVSAYDLTDYSDDTFMDYVDGFKKCYKDELERFIRYSAIDMVNKGFGLSSCIFIDGRFIEPEFYEDMNSFRVENLYTSSYFIRVLLLQLWIQWGCDEDFYYFVMTLESKEISLLVNTCGDEYIDIVTGKKHIFGDLSALDIPAYKYFAMGIWTLEYEFYFMLLGIQNPQGSSSSIPLPVYILERDPISDLPGENGLSLSIITNSRLADLYGGNEEEGDYGEPEDDIYDLLTLLLSLLS